MGETATRSALTDQQRVLFQVADGSEDTRRRLVRALEGGQCKGVALPDMADAAALRLVRAALESARIDGRAVDRGQLALVAATPDACGAGTLRHLVENALETVRTGHLDLLLLDARTLSLPPVETRALGGRKRILLEYWAQMLLLREQGIVQHVGVRNLSVLDVELLLSPRPADAPAVLAISAGVSPPTDSADPSPGVSELSSYVAFAHGLGIDVLVQLAFSQLDSMPPPARDRWVQTCADIAHRHAAATFQHLVTHELDGDGEFHVKTAAIKRRNTGAMDQEDGADAVQPLDSPLGIALRYFLQRGLAVVPVLDPGASCDGSDGDGDAETMLFHDAIHPFAGLSPAFSPHKVLSSVLTDDELRAVELALPMAVLEQHAGPGEHDERVRDEKPAASTASQPGHFIGIQQQTSTGSHLPGEPV